MLERSHSFATRDKNQDDIQRIMENILEKRLSLSTNTKRLGKSLIRINYFDNNVDKDAQKGNRITILQEPKNRVYIQIKGKLTDTQVEQLWYELDKRINNSQNTSQIYNPTPSKAEIIQDIKNLIDKRGYIVKDEDVQEFLENFIKQYERLPKEDEYNSIVEGYIIMVNEEKPFDIADSVNIRNEQKIESSELYLEQSKSDLSLNSYDSNISLMKDRITRRKCPSCGNDGLIHEVDDKTVIIMDYPKIYGKKYRCGQCSYEWRKK
ncbi:MAG: hypothetical protein JSV23_05920 [Promethearchaeota archaeon]|nr:MAG: hypothetical protein JSV23_05920 [Candidatus Lokiarchaeota archaeon]